MHARSFRQIQNKECQQRMHSCSVHPQQKRRTSKVLDVPPIAQITMSNRFRSTVEIWDLGVGNRLLVPSRTFVHEFMRCYFLTKPSDVNNAYRRSSAMASMLIRKLNKFINPSLLVGKNKIMKAALLPLIVAKVGDDEECQQSHLEDRTTVCKMNFPAVASNANAWDQQRSETTTGEDFTTTDRSQDMPNKQQYSGVDQLSAANVLHNIGTFHCANQKFDEACSSLQQALEVTEQQVGSDHLDVSVALSNLGNVQLEFGRMKDSLLSFHRALKIRWKALGSEDDGVAFLVKKIAEVELLEAMTESVRDFDDFEEKEKASELESIHSDLEEAIQSVGGIQNELSKDVKVTTIEVEVAFQSPCSI